MFGDEIVTNAEMISSTQFYCNVSLEKLLLTGPYDNNYIATATAFKYGHVKSFQVTASGNGGADWGNTGSYFHILFQPRDPELAIISPSTGPPSGGTMVFIVLPLTLESDEITEIRSLLGHENSVWCNFETINNTVPAIVASTNSMVIMCTSPPSSLGEATINLTVTITRSGQWMEQQQLSIEEEESNTNTSSRIVIAMGTFTYSESFNPVYAVLNMFPNIGAYSGGTHVTFDVIISGEEEEEEGHSSLSLDQPSLPPPSPLCCFGSILVGAKYDVSKRIITCVAPMAPLGHQSSSIPVSIVDVTSISWRDEVLCDVASPPAVGWFNYVPKVELHGVFPKKGPTIGGTNITLIGSGFESHVGTLECEFWGIIGSASTSASASVTTVAIVESDTRASCTSPAIADVSPIDGSGISSYVQLLSEAGTNIGVGLQLFKYIDIFPLHNDAQLNNIHDDIALELSPSLGPETGGTIVTIASSSEILYADAAEVCKFAGALSLVLSKCVSTNSIACITPPHPPGTVDVRISVDGQQYTTKHGLFTYHAMTETSAVSPSYGPSTGGTPVVIIGNGYIDSEAIMVSFGGPTIRGKFLNASAIEATTPSVSAAAATTTTSSHSTDTDQFTTVPVSISLNGVAGGLQTDAVSSSHSIVALFTYSHFHFEAFSWKLTPSSGPIEGGAVVSIWLPLDVESRCTLANFSVHLTDTYGDGVFGLSGEYESSHVIVESENQLSFVVPEAVMPGMVDVELLYGGTQATPFVHQFLYYISEGQGIVAMSPTFGHDNGGTMITVLGSGFTSLGPFSAPTCMFSVGSEAEAEAPADGDDSDSVVHVPARISSQDIITCTTPALGEILSVANPGPVSLQISLNGKYLVPGMLEFTYISALTVLSVWPSMGSINGGTRVVVRGAMFLANIAVQRGALGSYFSPPTLWCRFEDQLVMADEVIDSTTTVCTTPPIATSQVVGVSVGYNLLHFSEGLQQGFAYHDEISVTGLFPAIGQVEGGTAVCISGIGFAASINGKPSAVTCRFGN